MRWIRAGVVCVALLALSMAQPAVAGKVYRWTDRNGIVHYGDRAPDARQVAPAQVKVIRVPAQPGAVVRLRVEPDASGGYAAWADNQLDGPLEVMLHLARGRNVSGDPPLPAEAVVPARGSMLVARIGALDPAAPGEFELRLDAIPGDPRAMPQDVMYALPLPQRAPRVDQGYGGRFSHSDPQNRYAIDFAAEQGTPVLAARGGVVMQVESDFDKAGLDMEQYGGRANFVRILHDDGSMGLYAHLREGGVLVRPGERVRAGQRIGTSGNTGFTTGPHLHFAVQVNRGMRLESIPFRMQGVGATR
ncbi:MAG TPA: M23 family metallopeptidase [Xanthomonadaceae bacterium]|nr:M23 family metallopeptidase [Xanthomonadaceae bacterium]